MSLPGADYVAFRRDVSLDQPQQIVEPEWLFQQGIGPQARAITSIEPDAVTTMVGMLASTGLASCSARRSRPLTFPGSMRSSRMNAKASGSLVSCRCPPAARVGHEISVQLQQLRQALAHVVAIFDHQYRSAPRTWMRQTAGFDAAVRRACELVRIGAVAHARNR